jgi:acetoacetate decarboxylase
VSYFAQLEFAWLAACQNFWGRSGEIGMRYLRQAMPGAEPAGSGDLYSESSLRRLGTLYGDWLAEMALVPFLAAEEFVAALDRSSISVKENSTYFIDEEQGELAKDEKRGKRIILPLRIRDAAQGLAIYAVSTNAAQSCLDKLVEAELRQKQPNPFIVMDIGRGQTPLAIFVAHYREGDLGTHNELGVALFVTPKDHPSAGPGIYLVDLPVDQRLTLGSAGIWGLPKTLADLRLKLEEAKAHFTFLRRRVGERGAVNRPILTITFPRGGTSSSTAIPIYLYTLLDGRPHKTIFMRSGRGEGLGAGGGLVELHFDDASRDSLCKLFHDLGLAEKKPFIEAWSECMSGEFGEPRSLK